MATNLRKPLIVAIWTGGFCRQLRSGSHPAENKRAVIIRSAGLPAEWILRAWRKRLRSWDRIFAGSIRELKATTKTKQPTRGCGIITVW
ncbi:MAG: hypothetical protein US71_C0012G0021 [Parcubacteria group bacterium GW2011_GWD2_38_12]|nr:MAG: hypothetical protein US71_C0012G0021 [Parcubacteria group bacterium GW2011_GWD2_38_12]